MILVCEHLDLLVVPKITSMDGITSIIHTYMQYIYTNVLTIYTIYIHTYNTYILIIQLQMLTRLYSLQDGIEGGERPGLLAGER